MLSASPLTAADVLDVTPRVPQCSGQASDAVSAYTSLKVKNAPRLLHLSEDNMSKGLDQITESKNITKLGLSWRSSCTTGAQSSRSSIGWTLQGRKNTVRKCCWQSVGKRSLDGSACTFIAYCDKWHGAQALT